jgi:hypothetical protein
MYYTVVDYESGALFSSSLNFHTETLEELTLLSYTVYLFDGSPTSFNMLDLLGIDLFSFPKLRKLCLPDDCVLSSSSDGPLESLPRNVEDLRVAIGCETTLHFPTEDEQKRAYKDLFPRLKSVYSALNNKLPCLKRLT